MLDAKEMWVESMIKLFKCNEEKKFTGFSQDAHAELANSGELCLMLNQSRWTVWGGATHPGHR